MTSVIEAAGLTKTYGSRRGITDVTFAVTEGEAFGFLGPNGAGKMTTIRTLLGLLRPTGGQASIFGLDVWADAPRIHEQVSYVGSDPAYLGQLTAAEQLDYVARLRRLPKGPRCLSEPVSCPTGPCWRRWREPRPRSLR